MKKTFLIVTVNTRIEEFKEALSSIYSDSDLNDWHIVAVAQGYNMDESQVLIQFIEQHQEIERTTVIFRRELIGPHSARILGLQTEHSDIWCNLDDDMRIAATHNFEPILHELLTNPEVGFISGGWVKSEKQLSTKPIKDEFLRQPIVYTGGGLFYTDVMAELMKKHPDKNYLFDDIEWSLTAYIKGYENYRYKGSVIIHKVCSTGGRRVWVAQKSRDLPDPQLITLETASEFYKGVDNNYKIPSSSNLTPLAKQLHQTYKAVRGEMI